MDPSVDVRGVEDDDGNARGLRSGGTSGERACGQDEKDRDDGAETQKANTRLDITGA